MRSVRFTGLFGGDRLMLKNNKRLLGLFITFIITATGVIFWKIANDEIVYLCGNFSAGLKKSSVVKQLETANLSNYKHTINENGAVIVFSSRLYFVTNQCIIELDKREKVVLAGYK